MPLIPLSLLNQRFRPATELLNKNVPSVDGALAIFHADIFAVFHYVLATKVNVGSRLGKSDPTRLM
jgi:hypothetical protein